MKLGTKWLAAAAVAFAATASRAMFMDPPEAPVKRLLTNIAKELEKTPDDPHLLYLAGRTHAVAYAMGEDAKARAWPADGSQRGGPKVELPEFSTRSFDRLRFEGEADEVRLGHLCDGIRLLRRASELAKAPPETRSWDDDRPVLFLGLAWLLDDGSRFAPKLGHPEGVKTNDAVPVTERAAYDGYIQQLTAKTEDERKQAYVSLRRSLSRCWPSLRANVDAKDPLVREKAGALLTRWWQDQALDAYRKAFALTRERDLKEVKEDGTCQGTFSIARESGQAILRLLDDFPDPDANAKEAKAVKADLATFDSPGGFSVTPMIFPVSRAASLADLLAENRTARFDLAGDGVVRRWPWPSSDAGFLVWSPEGGKPIASGRQLFGARTWWIFWRDGFEPLRMLDDDGDGRLSGAELDGIGVWRDRDGNGVCDAGEVESAAAFGVAWIAVTATRTEDGVPANDRGIGLADGSTRPTYDWTPRSIAEPRARE
jgi:hypothetical protein